MQNTIVGLVHSFSDVIEFKKPYKFNQNPLKSYCVLESFQSLFSFRWKTVHQTFEKNFLECFCSGRKKSKYKDLILHNYTLVKLQMTKQLII